ncbi:hypothetical protein CQ10_29895 [Bradyrhizobium valentinum]|nr:hypothetical protein CQ10_29895 [Bradyrhizobium valentinum]
MHALCAGIPEICGLAFPHFPDPADRPPARMRSEAIRSACVRPQVIAYATEAFKGAAAGPISQTPASPGDHAMCGISAKRYAEMLARVDSVTDD